MPAYDDNTPMPFGIHKDKPLIEVPADHLIWLYENDRCSRLLRDYIKDNWDVLLEQAKEEKNR